MTRLNRPLNRGKTIGSLAVIKADISLMTALEKSGHPGSVSFGSESSEGLKTSFWLRGLWPIPPIKRHPSLSNYSFPCYENFNKDKQKRYSNH